MAYMDKMKYTAGPCAFCGQGQRITVIGSELFRYRQGAFVQDALTSNTPNEREFLISGMCSKCWDEMFPEEEEE